MTLFLQQVLDGIGNGVCYAFIALALTLVYRASSAANFAQGEMATLATFGTFGLWGAGVPIALAAAIAVAGSFVLGVVLQRVLIRRIDNTRFDGHLSILLVTLGLFLLINGISAYFWGFDTKEFPTIVSEHVLTLGGLRFSSQYLLIIGALAVVGVLLFVLFRYTKLGLAMRAAAESRESTILLGVDVDRVLLVAWGLAAALGALAGIMLAPRLFLEPNMMTGALIFGFAGAVLGGFDSTAGAVVGGIIVGISENLAGTYLPFIGSDLSIMVPFVIITVVLLIRPSGLFGSQKVVRV